MPHRETLLILGAIALGAAEPTQSLGSHAFATTYSGESLRVGMVGGGARWSGWTGSAVATVAIDAVRSRFDNDAATVEGGLFATVAVQGFPGWWIDVGGHGRWDDAGTGVASLLTTGIAGGGKTWGLVADGFVTDLRGGDGTTRRLHQGTLAPSLRVWTDGRERALWLGINGTAIHGPTQADPTRQWQWSQGGSADLYWGASMFSWDGWYGARANAVRYRGAVIQDGADEHRWGMGASVTRWLTPRWSATLRVEREHLWDTAYQTPADADTAALILSWRL